MTEPSILGNNSTESDMFSAWTASKGVMARKLINEFESFMSVSDEMEFTSEPSDSRVMIWDDSWERLRIDGLAGINSDCPVEGGGRDFDSVADEDKNFDGGLGAERLNENFGLDVDAFRSDCSCSSRCWRSFS